MKNVSRNKKKDLTLEIPQEKALPMQSTLNIKKEKLTLDIPQENGLDLTIKSITLMGLVDFIHQNMIVKMILSSY